MSIDPAAELLVDVLEVGMADLGVLQSDGVLRTSGLGSCVGLALYDWKTRTAGLAHIMLPSSEIAREHVYLYKFADTAIPELLLRMRQRGAETEHIVAKLAGGAQMFTFSGGESMRVGPRNVEACRFILQQCGIPITGEDTGGHYGRTVELYCNTGELHVRSMYLGNKVL